MNFGLVQNSFLVSVLEIGLKFLEIIFPYYSQIECFLIYL